MTFGRRPFRATWQSYERTPSFDCGCIWWAAVTLTTIGYGDVYPITAIGKALLVGMTVMCIGLIAMPTSILAAAFKDALRHDRNVRE